MPANFLLVTVRCRAEKNIFKGSKQSGPLLGYLFQSIGGPHTNDRIVAYNTHNQFTSQFWFLRYLPDNFRNSPNGATIATAKFLNEMGVLQIHSLHLAFNGWKQPNAPALIYQP